MDPFRQGYYFLADFVSDYRLINYSPMCSLQVSIRSASILEMCGVTCIKTASSWCYFYQHHNIMLAILKTLSALNCMKAIISYLFCAPSVIFIVLKYPYYENTFFSYQQPSTVLYISVSINMLAQMFNSHKGHYSVFSQVLVYFNSVLKSI